MYSKVVHMALFKEEQLDHAAESISRLRTLGIPDKDISVISGIPFSEKILDRPMSWTNVGRIGLAGAVTGFIVGLLLNFGTPFLYPLRVSNMPTIFPIPTSIVVTFELTMLGLLLSTFLGVFVETISPSFGPKGYHPSVSDGYIAVLFSGPMDLDQQFHTTFEELGATLEHDVEEEKLWL
jgi:hypothetical protein